MWKRMSITGILAVFTFVLIAAAAQAAGMDKSERTYLVTIQNVTTGGQPLTPPLVATHQGGTSIFTVGDPASLAVQEVAENGNLTPLMDALSNNAKVYDFDVGMGPLVPGSDPGGTGLDSSVSLVVIAAKGAQHLSFISMLICTNDGFTGLDTVKLPANGSVVFLTNAYDAGTEINTEDFADLVPPCPVLSGVVSDDPGTGVTNPALAENGVIHHHEGIVGDNDLDPADHGFSNPIAKVTITRLDMNADKFSAPLSGVAEVTGDGAGNISFGDSEATGLAQFDISKDGESISYSLDVQNIVDVRAAHIHVGDADVNGPVVVTLFGPSAPTGLFSGRLAQGSFTADDLVGPLAGGPLLTLIEALQTGGAYVNTHTPQNPAGEIRGQIGAKSNSTR